MVFLLCQWFNGVLPTVQSCGFSGGKARNDAEEQANHCGENQWVNRFPLWFKQR
jgi:hypothetical protein